MRKLSLLKPHSSAVRAGWQRNEKSADGGGKN